MNDKQKLVLKAILELSKAEKAEVVREAQIYDTRTFSEKNNLNESLNRVLGPTSGASCPYCGK